MTSTTAQRVHERWCPYPIAPREWCGAEDAHHDPDLLLVVGGGFSALQPAATALPLAPRRFMRVVLVDVSTCTQADLDVRYRAKQAQLGWLQRQAVAREWEDVQVDVIPVPVAMTGKVHCEFLQDLWRLGVEYDRAVLLARRILAVVVPGLAAIWRHAERQFIMAAHGQGWDDPGPRGGPHPFRRRSPAGGEGADPSWLHTHAADIADIRFRFSVGDELGARQRATSLLRSLGQSARTRLYRACGIPLSVRPSGAVSRGASRSARGWNVLQHEGLALVQARASDGDAEGARALAMALAAVRPPPLRAGVPRV